MKITSALLLISCLMAGGLSVHQVKSQDHSSILFDHLTVEEGLSQSTVWSITKDAEGYMWFGTRDGLNRYDSKNLKVYKNKESDGKSLVSNNIQCIFVDSEKTLWIGTTDGISLYNPDHDNFSNSRPSADIEEGLSFNYVTSITETSDGSLWIGTHGGLNKVISKNPLRYQHFLHDDEDPTSLLHNEVRALFIDREDNLWLGTSVGVSKLVDKGDGRYSFENYKLPAYALKGKSWINCLAEDNSGNILIGTEENGIKLLNRKTGFITSTDLTGNTGRPIECVRTMQRTRDNEIWIGTIDGLYIYNTTTKEANLLRNNPDDNYSLNDNSIRSIYIDPVGSYWLGTFYGGVNMYSPLARQFGQVMLTNTRNQKASKIAGAMVTDQQNNLWVSTDGNGLFCLNEKGQTTKQFRHLPDDPSSLSHNKIKCLLLDDHGLWIGTINGLNYYDFHTGKFRHYFHDPRNPNSIADDRIYDLKKDHEGNIWIGTYRGGLCRLNKETQKVDRFSYKDGTPGTLSSDGVTFIHEDSENNLWIGTISGLNKKSGSSDLFEHFGNQVYNNPSGGDYILCIHEDTQKRLWIGTRDNGLKMKPRESNTWKNFTLEDGLAGNNISGILEDSKGNLWVSTENGLSRLDPATFAIKNYNKRDGLVCKEFNFNSFHKDKKGMMYFGGYNGIVKFYPDSIKENKIPPVVSLTKLKLFNREVQIDTAKKSLLPRSLTKTSNLTFNYQQNVFSVEFAALSFINAGKNQYAYMLEGFENEWNYVTDPVATYMNLQPGDYTLLVKASNNDGVWIADPIQLKIHILPPPWKTWWAYTLYCCVILGLVYLLIHFNKVRWKLAHDLEIEHMEKEQQENLHRAKLTFFTNVAHEIRTPLTLIVSPVEIVSERYGNDPFLQRQLRAVKSNTSRLMRLINQLLDFQKQETGNFKLKRTEGNIVELLKEIVYSFSNHASSRHVGLTFKSTSPEIQLSFDRDELEKVFCNLLHNAFKFTPGGGEVTVTVDIDNSLHGNSSCAKITFDDNGIGIPPEDLPRIFNRFFQAENNTVSESGFGIGLALARGIIQLHGGTLDVESREASSDHSGFTKFTILLPLEGHDQPVEVPETLTVSAGRKEEITSSNKITLNGKAGNPHNQPLILLIEDNEEIRSCLRTILSSTCRILEASDGQEGWELTTHNLPDLVVSDIAMPNMDGLEFTRMLKKDERTNHIPVILLTARGAMDHHVEGIGTGADDYITKPFHAHLLQLKIRNLLHTRELLKVKYRRFVTLEPKHEEIEDPESKFLARLMTLLETNLNDPDFNVSKLVTEIGMSRPVLFRKVKMLTGLSVIDLLRSTRLKKAEMLLKQKRMTISEVAFTVGFNDPKYFSKSFRSQFGKTPTEYVESLG